MQLCTLQGDMCADRTDGQYPKANVCAKCVEKYLNTEDSPIVHVIGQYHHAYGEECALCELHISEE